MSNHQKIQKFYVWIQIVHIMEFVIQLWENVFAILDIVEKIVKVNKWVILKILILTVHFLTNYCKIQKFFVWIQIVHIMENVIQPWENVIAILDIVE